MDTGQTKIKNINPRENASILSIITFFYTHRLFKQAKKRALDDDDVYQVRPCLASANLGRNLLKTWERQQNALEPSLLKALLSCFGKTYVLLGVIQFCVRTAIIFVQPTALGRLVAYFQPEQTSISQNELYQNAALVVGLSFLTTLYNHNYEQLVNEVGIKVKTAVSALVYRKCLRLGPGSFSKSSPGKIVTLITKDVTAFENALTFVNDMWIGVIQTCIIAYIIFRRIGISVLVGLSFYMLVVPLQFYFGKKSSLMRVSSAKKTDERLQFTTEALSAIKTIKMYTWESFFVKKLIELRKDELNKLAPVFYLKCIVLIVGGLASNMSFFLLLMTYIWSGNLADAETVYFIQSCFQSLKGYISISIPYGIAQCSEVYAALRRLQEFLTAEEAGQRSIPTSDPKVHLDHVSVRVGETSILKDVSMDVRQGLFLVTGNVGSGKTALLKTILGEYPSDGHLVVDGTISYAAQEPWLFPATIRQNILFGERFDQGRYEEVVSACALNVDFSRLKDGDQTVLGDRGVNLSKGQQARINLARAVYRASDVYLLDDCLSALDNKVNLYVFKRCVMEFLKGKIVVLVTHNVNHIKMVNGQNTLFIEAGSTLSLEQQRSMLDRRITYYIDDDDDLDVFNREGEEEEENNDEPDETSHLLEDQENAGDLYHEDKRSGKVNMIVYLRYFRYSGGLLVFLLILAVFVMCQVANSYSDKLLSQWVNTEPKLSALITKNLTNTTEYEETTEQRSDYLTLYCLLIIGAALLIFLRVYLLMYRSALMAARKLHKSMATSVMNSYMTFFDGHYVGNIINRFSKDLTTTDEVLPLVVYEIFRLTLAFIGIIYLIATVNVSFLIVGALLLLKMYFIRRYYIPTGRSMKRLEAATRSPMIGYLNASLEGLSTIRAYEKQSVLIEEFDKHQDHYTSAYYMMICTTRAFGFYLDLLSANFTAAIVLKFTFFSTDSAAGDVGLAISQAMMLTGLLQWAVRYYSELENNMTAVERVLEYTDIPTENKTEGLIRENWPTRGVIQYDRVSLTYQRSNQQVLRDVSFLTFPREKIGVVGRTGAGKSSIIATLFRLYDIEGRILIDGEDITNIPILFLRSRIAIIPQDPVLFTGTIRSNIDPTSKYSDEDIWKAIEKSNIKHLVPSLEDTIGENGAKYSAGQKQLICLARALVSHNKIIVLDEATASMDPETSRLLQDTIKENFAQCTVLVIAHRLNTVANSDRILVVDHGEIVEFDTPSALLANQDGVFYNLMKQSGSLSNG
uniref:Putative ABCC protein n=1 Tax=Chrysomela populi TaxID=154003 RepID=A0A0U9HSY7_CHRPP